MFLEAQFGADNITPISIPRSPPLDNSIKEDDASSEDEETSQNQELERLHKIGIPVPGVEIKVDKSVAKVWLEDLEVECANRILEDRVRRVVERAVEVTAPLFEN